MSRWALRSLGLAGRHLPGSDTMDTTGQWLSYYDPEYAKGAGAAWWTEDVDEALVFDTPVEAMELVHIVPNSMKIRPDGQPNRPLSAYHLEVINLDKREQTD